MREHAAADCCATDAADRRAFDERIAELTADTDFPEMVDVSAVLLDLLEDDVEAASPTVLELGCGSGALTVALLKRGAARARGFDLSPGMLAVAVRRAEQADVADRAAFTLGDGATAAVTAGRLGGHGPGHLLLPARGCAADAGDARGAGPELPSPCPRRAAGVVSSTG